MKMFKVATFFNPEHRSGCKITAYLRDYNAAWDGCIEYDVEARNGRDAKMLARTARFEHERKRGNIK